MDVDAVYEALITERPGVTEAAVAFLAWLATRGGSVVVTPIFDAEGFAITTTVRFGNEGG